MLDAMYNLVVAANDFGYNFMLFYEKSLAADDDYDESAIRSTLERFYLKNLTYTCNAYVKVYLPLIHESPAVKNGDNELYTGFNYSALVNNMLLNYQSAKTKIQSFDRITGDLSSSQKANLDYFRVITKYEVLYQKSCRVMISVDKEWKTAMNEHIEAMYDSNKTVSAANQCVIGFVSDCNNDCVVMQDMLKGLGEAL